VSAAELLRLVQVQTIDGGLMVPRGPADMITSLVEETARVG
jgi:hypothetical protein